MHGKQKQGFCGINKLVTMNQLNIRPFFSPKDSSFENFHPSCKIDTLKSASCPWIGPYSIKSIFIILEIGGHNEELNLFQKTSYFFAHAYVH